MTRMIRLFGWLGVFLAMNSVVYAAVAPERLHLLSRGINLDSAPFEQPRSAAGWSGDLTLIKRSGLLHIRIFVNQDWLTEDLANNWHFVRLDQIVKTAVHDHLAVILCLYSDRYPLTDAANAMTVQHWLMAWQQLARHYQSVSPSWMYFEIANEPGMKGSRWSLIQEQLLTAIRQIAPMHTLLLTPSPLAMVWSLPEKQISEDANVVYIFHLYQPMVFTHQSAGWADPAYQQIMGLVYPPDAANVHSILSRPLVAGNAGSVKDLAQYARIGGTMMNNEIAVAIRWAKEHDVPIVVTEFGNYATAPQASRAAWLKAAREEFEAAGFGWTVWQYEGSFGIKADLQRGCDLIVQALGLCQ